MSETLAPSRLLTDRALLSQCRQDLYRGSGPGGQKRNKTSNAVRLVHPPTGTMVTATESRSLAVNQLHALRRLRVRLSADFREVIDRRNFVPPEWLDTVRHQGRFTVSHRHPLYAALGGLVLDLLVAHDANPAAVAVNLGVSTSAVIGVLEAQTPWWAVAQRLRGDHGLAPLTRRH